MKILVMTMQFPHFPAPGGQTRQYFLLKEAAKEHDITLLTLSPPPNEEALVELKSFVNKVIILEKKYSYEEQPAPSSLSYFTLFKEFFEKNPFEVRKWIAKREVREYLSQIDPNNFDLIQVEHSELAHWVDGLFENTPKLLVMHNVNYLIYRRFFEIAPWGKEKVWALAQWQNMRKYEKSLAGKFTAYATMSHEDSRMFLNVAPHSQIQVVPNGVDTEYFRPCGTPDQEENVIVYTGYMGWKPSIDAVIHFYHNVFSELKLANADLKFYIVGKNPSPEVKELANDKSVVVTGFVEDVRPYIQRAKLVVVPLRVGGGTRLKILEAMSMGKAIISTSVGAEGLNVEHGEDIILADSNEKFTYHAQALLQDADRRAELGKRARGKVIQEYDWPQIGLTLNNLYRKLSNSGSKVGA